MDETFSGHDVVMEANVCELINEIACLDELNTIIVVTHDVTAAATVADHLWLMGRDRDPGGNFIPGARIQETYDLIDRDLCWHPELTNSPRSEERRVGKECISWFSHLLENEVAKTTERD